ncbi:glycosyltransferase family 4 protein [Lacimicrobium alkaliphilum]|uniref:glycosyltransferase family 4 protein n=1 Tax=Lacimicrobium alkaliphilum TaxID=1526571 RepID=UPI000A674F76|nr:glycosyltransferase family 4 protein [Lacimicrobium alkaliphilum]
MPNEQNEEEISLILGNSNPNFSGVTSTMLQVSAEQRKWVNLRIMGKHHLTDPDLYISFWDTVRLCRKPLKNGKFRVFHARRVDEMIQALILRYLFRCKLKIVFSSAAQRKRSGSTVWITRKMDAVVAVSQRSAGFLADPPDIVIPHGIQTHLYQPARNKALAWQALGYGGKIGIGMLGRVRKQKGVHHFVRACIASLPKYPDVTAVIVGAISSSHREFVEQLKSEVEEAGLSSRIIFTGELPFKQIPQIFSALSVVAALSDNEGFGLTVPEAMSAEAAVLATDAGAWPEIIRQDIDGYVVPVNASDEINQKLDVLLSDTKRCETMGKRGRERVLEHYSIEREARQLLEFFETLR